MASPRSKARVELVPFRDALAYWARLGFINFGGPAGQIALMHQDLVDRKKWIGEQRFLHALNFCMFLPGPEAQQLAIYIGWLLNGTLGGIVAGILFILPAFFLILALSWTYAVHGDIDWVAATFYGLKAAVIAVVLAAVIRVGSKALKHPLLVGVAVAAFVAIFFVKVPFPLIVIGAAVVGLIVGRRVPLQEAHGEVDEDVVLADHHEAEHIGDRRRALRILLLGLLIWWGPLLLVILLRGSGDTLSKEALFFSQTAMVTFGGAYAVLAYINQAAVQHFGWLEPGQMVTGLGLAESTPGPLIMVTEFVGFLAAYRFPGGLDPVVAGILGATVTTWATFAPCFLWIFLGAPYIERLRGNKPLNSALAGVTAAVVGVIANLALSFAIVALFSEVNTGEVLGFTYPAPALDSVDLYALALAAFGFIAIWRFKVNVLYVIAACALAGLIKLA
jgi:chromate transporter